MTHPLSGGLRITRPRLGARFQTRFSLPDGHQPQSNVVLCVPLAPLSVFSILIGMLSGREDCTLATGHGQRIKGRFSRSSGRRLRRRRQRQRKDSKDYATLERDWRQSQALTSLERRLNRASAALRKQVSLEKASMASRGSQKQGEPSGRYFRGTLKVTPNGALEGQKISSATTASVVPGVVPP